MTTPKKVNLMGMELDEWKYESCLAHWAEGDTWATLYEIQSGEPGKGHATTLLLEAKKYYEARGKKVGGSVALNDRMKKLYEKVGIPEYERMKKDNRENIGDSAQKEPCLYTLETGKHESLQLTWRHQPNDPLWIPYCHFCGWIDMNRMFRTLNFWQRIMVFVFSVPEFKAPTAFEWKE